MGDDRRRLRYARAITKDANATLTGTADATMAVADEEHEDLREALRQAYELLDSARCAHTDPGLTRSWAQTRRRWRDKMIDLGLNR